MRRNWFVLCIISMLVWNAAGIPTGFAAGPMPPRNLIVAPASITETAVTLVWDKPEEYANVTEYEIYQDDVFVGSTSKTHYTVTELTPDTQYTFYVLAKEAAATASQPTERITAVTDKTGEIIDITKAPYNAIGNGRTVNTAAIQKAIDDCPENGTVLVPAGTFMTGALDLKSNMTLLIEKDGVLQGTTSINDYLPMIDSRFEGWELKSYRSLINAGTLDSSGGYNCENITICGEGKIKGGGTRLGNAMTESTGDLRSRGRLISFHNCQTVNLSGISVENPPAWTVHMVYSDTITTYGVNFYTKGVRNGDGWDPDSSTNCMIFDCDFDTGDDCIAIKSGKNPEGNVINKPAKNIKIFDCRFAGGLGLAIGSEMSGGVENVSVRDCTMGGTRYGLELKATEKRGGYIKNITVQDSELDCILIHSVSYNDDGEAAPDKPFFSDMTFENIRVSGYSYYGSAVTPLSTPIELTGFSDPDHYIKNLKFKNVVVGDTTNVIKNIQVKYCDTVTFEHVKQTNKKNPNYAISSSKNIVYDKNETMSEFTDFIEAEDMLLNNYTIEKNAAASGGYCIKATGTGTAQANYVGESAVSDISITYFDENDGKAGYKFFINDILIDQWTADRDLGSASPDEKSKTVRNIKDVVIKNGDIIKLEGTVNVYDPARVDRIEISRQNKQLTVNMPVLVDQNGQPVAMLRGGAVIGAGVQTANTTEHAEAVVLVMAVYDKANLLEKIVWKEKQVQVGTDTVMTEQIQLPDELDGRYVKLFVWSSLQEMTPLCETTQK